MTHIPINEFKPWSALQEKEPVFIMEEIEGSKYHRVTGSKMLVYCAERIKFIMSTCTDPKVKEELNQALRVVQTCKKPGISTKTYENYDAYLAAIRKIAELWRGLQTTGV